jgi:hypothetical protein
MSVVLVTSSDNSAVVVSWFNWNVKMIVKVEMKRAWKKPATNCFNVFIAAIDHRHQTRAAEAVAVPWREQSHEEGTKF